jgi:type IV pilus assembly protein PilP
MDRVLEPLEKFETKALQVVAIVWGTEKPRALVQDPESNVHTVAKGQRIGKNEGFVAEIREGEIVVVEFFDLNGKVIKESVVLPIRK